MDITSLTELRTQVDEVDAAIVKLLNKRAKLASQIGSAKGEAPVYDPTRERAIIARLNNLNDGPLSKGAMEEVFTSIITACRELQQNERQD